MMLARPATRDRRMRTAPPTSAKQSTHFLPASPEKAWRPRCISLEHLNRVDRKIQRQRARIHHVVRLINRFDRPEKRGKERIVEAMR